MNKAELINAAAEKAGLSKKDTETAINAAIEVISDCLAEGDKVQLVGFGAFEVKSRAERIGRNPKTQGEHQDPRLQGARVQARQGAEGHRREVSQKRGEWCPRGAVPGRRRRRGGCPHPPAGR